MSQFHYRFALAALAFVAAITASAAVRAEGSLAELKHFPAVLKGYDRFVLHLPPKPSEADYQVQIIPGKQSEIDCNTHRLISRTSTRTVKGFGYDYLVVSTQGKIAATLIGCGTQAKRSVFVAGEATMRGYNSKLPVVVFVPRGLAVRYRIWNAGQDLAMDPTPASAVEIQPVPAKSNKVVSTQKAGKTVVIRKRDKYGNRINFKQSD